MAYTKQKFKITIASGVDSGFVDTGAQSQYQYIYVNNDTGFEIDIWGSGDGENYQELAFQEIVSSVVQWQSATVGTALSGNYVQLPPLPRYIKVITTGNVAADTTVNFVTG